MNRTWYMSIHAINATISHETIQKHIIPVHGFTYCVNRIYLALEFKEKVPLFM